MKINNDNERTWIKVTLSTSMLFQNNRPNINFWVYCLLNDYIEKTSDDRFVPTIDIAYLIEDGTEEQNRYIEDLLQKNNIVVYPTKD